MVNEWKKFLDKDGLVQLTSANFDTVIKDKQPTLVIFTAPCMYIFSQNLLRKYNYLHSLSTHVNLFIQPSFFW